MAEDDGSIPLADDSAKDPLEQTRVDATKYHPFPLKRISDKPVILSYTRPRGDNKVVLRIESHPYENMIINGKEQTHVLVMGIYLETGNIIKENGKYIMSADDFEQLSSDTRRENGRIATRNLRDVL